MFPVESEVSDKCKELLVHSSGVCVLSGTAGFLGCVQQFAEEADTNCPWTRSIYSDQAQGILQILSPRATEHPHNKLF